MPRKRDFAVEVKDDAENQLTFHGKDCEIKDKSLSTRLGISSTVKETIACKEFSFKSKKSSRRTKRKMLGG